MFGEIVKPKEAKMEANESFSSILVIKKPNGLRVKPMQLGILKHPDSPKKHIAEGLESEGEWC